MQLYLASQGWRRDDASSTAQGNVYRYPAFPDAEALLPARRELADYTERMGDVVQMLAAVEQRSVWQVMADLLTPPADVLRLQITAQDATLGTVPLAEGIRLIEGGKELLLAAACSAHQSAADPHELVAEPLPGARGHSPQGGFFADGFLDHPGSRPQVARSAGFKRTRIEGFVISLKAKPRSWKNSRDWSRCVPPWPACRPASRSCSTARITRGLAMPIATPGRSRLPGSCSARQNSIACWNHRGSMLRRGSD